ncbi:MAG TPA: acyl-CoA dehydrogenase family protein [Amaricoccus sp.]|nr:acyl-CoA dehydrogenase family protein [Amaricoccus sp.]
MDFALSDEQVAIRDTARVFGRDRIAPHAQAWEAAGTMPRAVLEAAGALGFGAMLVPEDMGGAGLDRLDAALVVEALAMACPAVASFVSIHNMCAAMIARHGGEALRARILPGAVGMRTILAYCLTEPGSGSDAAALRTRAGRSADGWILNGSKAFISGGGFADAYVVMARTGGEGPKGISAIVVDAGTPGLSFGAPERKMGWKAQPTAMVHLDDLRVPAANLLGAEGEGFFGLTRNLAQERLSCAVGGLAQASAAIGWTVDHVRDRTAFGRPLGALQTVRHRLAELVTEVEVAQHFLDRCVLEHAAVQEVLGHLHLGDELGEPVADGLQRPERAAERRAVAYVVDGPADRRGRLGQPADGTGEPLLGEVAGQPEEALALGAEQVRRRDAEVVEVHHRRRLCLPAHLALRRPERQAGRAGVDDDRGDPLRPLAAGARHHDVGVGEAAAGDEGLAAVQDPAVGAAAGAGAERGGVGARARLGQAVGEDRSHADGAGQDAGAQRLAAVAGDHRGAHVVDRDEARHRRARHRQRLDDQRRVEPVEPGAAHVLGHQHRAEAERARRLEHRARHRSRRLPRLRVRRDPVAAEDAGRVADRHLLVGEGEVHQPSHGSKRRTPVSAKSRVLRVQSVRSWTRAVAAMRPSCASIRRPAVCIRAERSPHASATSRETGRITSPKPAASREYQSASEDLRSGSRSSPIPKRSSPMTIALRHRSPAWSSTRFFTLALPCGRCASLTTFVSSRIIRDRPAASGTSAVRGRRLPATGRRAGTHRATFSSARASTGGRTPPGR